MAIAHPFFLAECERLIRTGSSTFYRAFSFLPSPRREAVFVVYAFCRLIDNAVDEPEQSPYTLDELEARFLRLESADGHFIWPALRWLFETFPVSREPFLQQMEGQRLDGKLTRYETLAQLDRYCYLVAGTVGEMLLPILHDRPDDSIVRAGVHLGKALQIVNIVRDIGEDWQRGRRYVPQQWMDLFGVTEEGDFLPGRPGPAFRELLEELMSFAEAWLALGLEGLERYPRDSAFCIELAARSYMAILDSVRASGYDVFGRRAFVGDRQKLAIAADLLKKYPTAALSAALRQAL